LLNLIDLSRKKNTTNSNLITLFKNQALIG
jgi:hypothetical protein